MKHRVAIVTGARRGLGEAICYQLAKDGYDIACMDYYIIDGDGKIELPILTKTDSMRRIIDAQGKPSLTYYRVLTQYSKQSLIECVLTTGRTHQIRVHMAAIGHPLSGDELYGSKTKQNIYLDSVEISFLHPYTFQVVTLKKGSNEPSLQHYDER